MFFPTRDAAQRASELQQAARRPGTDASVHYDQDDANRAAVHTREDIVVVCSLLTDLHRQSVNISRGVWALVVIAALVLLRALHVL